MTALDAFALWLGMGLIKSAAVVLAVWIAGIAWRGTTDPDNYGD